jgi:hypothetical protein
MPRGQRMMADRGGCHKDRRRAGRPLLHRNLTMGYNPARAGLETAQTNSGAKR